MSGPTGRRHDLGGLIGEASYEGEPSGLRDVKLAAGGDEARRDATTMTDEPWASAWRCAAAGRRHMRCD